MVRPITEPSEKWTEAEALELQENISKLYGYSCQRDAKYNRNYNRYFNNGFGPGDARATIWSAGHQSLGFNRAMFDDASLQTKLNIIKSVVDTIMSKVSQARVRPYIDAVQGDYKTIKAARAAQTALDALFDAQKIYERAPEVMRGAMLFDGGHWWVDDDNLAIEPVPHWELFVDPYESTGGNIRRCTYGMRWRKEYPFVLAKEQFPNVVFKQTGNPRTTLGEFVVYYDLIAKTKYYCWNKDIIYKKTIDYDRLPFTAIWWNRPLTGWSTTTLADDLYTIQVQIDEIEMRIDQALRQSPFNSVFVPIESTDKGTMLTNEAGLIVPYNPGPEGAMPVVATPAPISAMYVQLLDLYIQKAYEFGGVSQLSAQAKKPAGIQSGVALQTLEDVESERHNVTVQNYIHSFVELAEIAVEVFPKDADVLPKAVGRGLVRWSDVKAQKDLFKIQFSAGSALAKDPATKIQQIQQLQMLGINLQPILPQLLEIPDLETAYSATTASYDYAQSVIERAIETGETDFAPIANIDMLFGEAIRWFLRLSADEANKKYLDNLKKLIEAIQETTQAATPEVDEAVPAPANAPAPGPVAAPAMPAAPMGVA